MINDLEMELKEAKTSIPSLHQLEEQKNFIAEENKRYKCVITIFIVNFTLFRIQQAQLPVFETSWCLYFYCLKLDINL